MAETTGVAEARELGEKVEEWGEEVGLGEEEGGVGLGLGWVTGRAGAGVCSSMENRLVRGRVP